MRFLSQSLSLAIAALLVSCSSQEEGVTYGEINEDGPYTPIALSAEQTVIAEKSNDMSVNILKDGLEGQHMNNILFSPLNSTVGLAIIANMSDADSQAKLLEVLGYSDMENLNEFCRNVMTNMPVVDPENVINSTASALWLNSQFNINVDDYFASTAAKYFNFAPVTLDFKDKAAVETLNSWVSRHTNGLINEFFNNPLDNRDELTVTSTLYFKGIWRTKFRVENTKKGVFTDENGLPVQDVDFMNGVPMADYARTEHAKVVALPYGKKSFEMVVAVPTSTDVPYDVIADEAINAELRENVSVNLTMPKFTTSCDFTIDDYLQSQGINYSDMKACHLTRNNSDDYTLVMGSNQSAQIIVDEQGTEAASAFKSDWVWADLGNEIVKADHPFVYFIRERESGIILFMGVLRNPKL